MQNQIVKRNILILWLIYAALNCGAQNTNSAKMDFLLPKGAKYTVTNQQFETARKSLQEKFQPDTNQLARIISPPCMCGPGLWHLLKDSPFFSTPPKTKTICKIPLPNGKTQELPAALIQDATEAANFRAALAVLISKKRKTQISTSNPGRIQNILGNDSVR